MKYDYDVLIRGEYAGDDGLEIEMQRREPSQTWWEIPLPQCPDCGGDLVWWEGGYVPGTRRCLGAPSSGGRAANPVHEASPHARQQYDENGGCGSLFQVEARTMGVYLCRTRLYPA